MKELVRAEIAMMRAYQEEPAGGLNLMNNTNLFGRNPALDAALARLDAGALSEYPSLTSTSLRAAVAAREGLHEDMVVTGNGSNELIDVVMRTFLEPGETVAYHWPSFSMVPLFTRANHGVQHPVPLREGWQLDVDGLLAARAKVTFVVRPNNPTGNAFPRAEVERIVREAAGIVVVDEAYGEFMEDPSFVREVREGADRLVVLRTLSKAHGLAGLRIGYAVAGREAAVELAKVRGPFRLNALSEAVGALALQDPSFVEATVKAVREERPRLARMLQARGFEVYPSDANFLLTKPPVPAHALHAALAASGIWTRDFGGDLAPYLRITVGPPEATAQLQRTLDDTLPKLAERAG